MIWQEPRNTAAACPYRLIGPPRASCEHIVRVRDEVPRGVEHQGADVGAPPYESPKKVKKSFQKGRMSVPLRMSSRCPGPAGAVGRDS